MYIPRNKQKKATVQRLTSTRGSGGYVVDETYSTIFGTHIIDLQPYTTTDLIANEQLKFKITHWVFPQRDAVVKQVRIGDFYYIKGKLYRIIEMGDHYGECYFKVRDEAAEKFSEAAAVLQSAFVVENLGPGVYTYGSGLLAGIGPFSAKPILLDMLMNDGAYYINNPTTSGFEIVDRLMGAAPVVSIRVEGVLA